MAGTARDTVNRRRLAVAVLPLVVSLLIAGTFYYHHVLRQDVPREIRIGLDAPGSNLHDLFEAVARLVEARRPGLKITLDSSSDTDSNINRLEAGEIQFAAVSADAVTRPRFTMIANLFPDTYHIIARRDSPIENINDLPGQRIAIPLETDSANRSFWFLIGQYGLSPERMRARPMETIEAIEALKTGDVDAIFVMRPPGDRRIRWLTDAISVRIVAINQADAMHLRRGVLKAVTIPMGAYSGTPPVPDRAITSVAADRILVTHATMPSDLVRDLTSVLFENRRELSLSSRLAGFISQPDLSAATVLPLHPGARAFYDRDQPSFFQENAEPIGVTVSVTAILVSLFLWLKRTWNERRKGRTDVYNLELVQLVERAGTVTDGAALGALKTELFAMLSQVVRDLDEDRIDGNGFHFFAFTWEAALAAIRENETRLGIELPEPPGAIAAVEKLQGHGRAAI